MSFAIKRVYEAPVPQDGLRILVDRLWPRGFSKETASWQRWAKEVSPSNALRQKFHGHPELWEEFCVAYAQELDAIPNVVADLKVLAQDQTVTLLYAARDEVHNNAAALRAYLEQQS